MAVSRVTTAAPAWGQVAGEKRTVRATAPGATAPRATQWSGVAGAVAQPPQPQPPSSYVGPTTSTAPAPPSTYNMNVPGATEGLYAAMAPAVARPGYAEAYAQAPAYQAAQQSTKTNQLFSAYGGAMAQPTAFENYAYSTTAPTGGLYGVIAANQGQVTGPNDVLNHGRFGSTDSGQGDRAFSASSYMVTDPTRIGGYMADTGAYGGAAREGFGDDVAAATSGLVAGNTVGGFAADPNAQYRTASGNTAAERELRAAGESMASGVDSSTASGRYWEDLQRNPTALPDANLDAYYDRQRTKAQQDIDRVMAARGLFGSSASVDASREMMLDLAAQQVKDESDYSLASALARNDIMSGAAGAADEAGISRYVSRNEAARGVDSAALGLGRLGLDARTAQDENSLARYVAQNEVAQGIDNFGLGLYLGRGELMNRSDLTDIGRFDAYTSAADALDDTDISAFNARTNALDAGGRLDVDRFRANTDATAAADRTSLDSYIARSNVMRDAGNMQLDRFNSIADLATSADAASRSLYTAGSDVARTADQSLSDRYRTLIDSAGAADLSRTGRAQLAADTQYNQTRLLDSIINSGYGDLIQSDEDLLGLITQLGLGSEGMKYQGALGNEGSVGASNARLQQIGAQADADTQRVLQMIFAS